MKLRCFLAAAGSVLALLPFALRGQSYLYDIDFESPTYTVGMNPGDGSDGSVGDYPSPWVHVGSGVAITSTDPLAGSQSLYLDENAGNSYLWVQTSGQYDVLTFSILIKPHHVWTGYNNFVAAGSFALYADGTSDPFDAGSALQASLTFDANGSSTHTLDVYGDAGSSNTDTGLDWTSDSLYTVQFTIDLLNDTTSVGLYNSSMSLLWSDSGTYTGGALDDFQLQFGAPNVTNYALIDSVAITSAVPEPATYAVWFGCASLGLVAWRRRRRQR